MNYAIKSIVAVLGIQAAMLAVPMLAQAQEPIKKPVPKPHHVEHKGKMQERAPATPAAAAPAAAPAAAASANETTNFQGWTVTCTPVGQGGQPRTCMAQMGVLKSKEDPRPILMMNIAKTGGAATLIVQTPTTVDLTPGVNLQIGNGAPRHLTYVSCEPALCTAAIPLDDALAQELAAAPKAVATWVGLGVGEVRVEYALQEARNTIAFLGTR
jgi:invasion protein IalB